MADMGVLAPWRPGDNICETTVIADVMSILAFGQGDQAYTQIAQKLSDRGCKLVEHLRSAWTRSELLSTIRSLNGLKKSPHSYVAGMLTALRIELEGEEAGFKTEKKSKGFSGGDMMDRSQKIKPRSGFDPRSYDIDGALYNYLPAKNMCQYLDDEQEKLLLDLILLYMNADSEACLGTYLPEGLPLQLAKLHRARLPPFKPKKSRGIAGCETELSLSDMAKKYKDRVQNARNHTYKRMTLDQSFAEHFSEQIARHLIFLPADDDSLVDSVRNEAFAKFLGIFQGKIARTKVESPQLLPFNGAVAATTPRVAATADATTPATADATTPATAAAEAADADADEGGSEEGECFFRECFAAEDNVDMDALDGMALGRVRVPAARVPAPPRMKPVSKAASAAATSAATKKAKAAEKRSAAREVPGRPPAKKKQLIREPDSSDEDDSSEDEEASSAAARPKAAHPKAPTRRPPPAKKSPPAAKPPSTLALPSLSFAPPPSTAHASTAHASTAHASAIGNSLSPEMSPAPTSPITPHTAGPY